MFKCDYCGKQINIGDWPDCESGHVPIRECNAARFDAVVVFKDKKGNYIYPGNNKEKTPRGCIRVEMTDLPTVRKFEAEVNESERRHLHDKLELRDRIHQAQKSDSRSKLRQQMETMSARGKQFALTAMQQNDQRRNLSNQATRIDPKFRVAIFSDNESSTRQHQGKR